MPRGIYPAGTTAGLRVIVLDAHDTPAVRLGFWSAARQSVARAEEGQAVRIKADHMHVFEVRDDKLLGICDVTLDDQWAIRGVRVMEGQNGAFVSLPSYKNREGSFQGVAFPITKEAREALNKAVLNEYEHTRGKAVEAVATADR